MRVLYCQIIYNSVDLLVFNIYNSGIMSAKKITIDKDLLTKLFRDENLPVNTISKMIGISRGCITKNLIELGFTPPTITDGNNRSYSTGRKAVTAPAHNARRGNTNSDEQQSKIAQFYSGQLRSPYEKMMYQSLVGLGEKPFPNLAVGRYNIDLAFEDVKLAVEVDGGNWHTCNRKKKQDSEKTAFLEALGWTVIRYTFCKKYGFDVNAYACDTVTTLKRMRDNPLSV
jgi:very-short-patch-repair endonuclease